MDDLVTWLMAQVAKDERIARSAMEAISHRDDPEGIDRWYVSDVNGIYTDLHSVYLLGGSYEYTDEGLARHVVNWQPNRVLAECEAKRKIVTLYATTAMALQRNSFVGPNRQRDEAAEDVLGAAIQELAWVYRDRPGYRDEWCRVTLERGDLVLKVDDGIEGSVFDVDGHRVQVWWEDDSVSWESMRSLKELPREGGHAV
jgi:hypothetical protein